MPAGMALKLSFVLSVAEALSHSRTFEDTRKSTSLQQNIRFSAIVLVALSRSEVSPGETICFGIRRHTVLLSTLWT
jgi:hypothetical protein